MQSMTCEQWGVLEPLLQRVFECNPFQRARLVAAGGVPGAPSEFFAKVPFTLKSELASDQAASGPYGTNLSVGKGDGFYPHVCQTSGTTSEPLAVCDSEAGWSWLLENWRLGFEMAGLRAGQTAYFAFSFGPFLGFWTAFEAAKRAGMRCVPGGGLSTLARLHAILRYRAEVLFCTPTYAMHLAAVAKAEGLDPLVSPVRTILVAGEPGGSLPSVRARLAEAFPGAEVVDHYGMTEVGPVAFALRGEGRSLRVLEGRYLVEVVDPESGLGVVEGAVGELVLTPLGREDWPLLRYRTGDLVRVVKRGNGYEFDGGILGRADDMVIVRGVNLYPGAVEEVVRGVLPECEYRVVVDLRGALAEVCVEVETQRRGGEKLLEKAFEQAFSLRIPVREVPAGELPRFELKARRWIFDRG